MTKVMVVVKPRVLTTLCGELARAIIMGYLENLRRKEAIKRASGQMEALHQYKNPSLVVLTRLLQALHSRHDLIAMVDIIADHSSMSKFSFFRGEPACGARCIWQEHEASEGNGEGNDTLEEEKPVRVRYNF